VLERQPKWAANAAQLIEYYSAQGLLAEVVMDAEAAEAAEAAAAQVPVLHAQLRRLTAAGEHQTGSTAIGGISYRRGSSQPYVPHHRSRQMFLAAARAAKTQERLTKLQQAVKTAAARVPPPPAGTLAAIGYCPSISSLPVSPSCTAAASVLAASSSCSSGSSSNQLHSAPSSSHGVATLQKLGWCNAQGRLTAAASSVLLLHPVEPVVSSRLVTSKAQRQAVLAAAEASSGLSDLPHLFAVPTQTVSSTKDAEWVAAPGRYAVSRKCDGTRYLLLVAGDGQAYLLNRAGALYQYPTAVSAASATAAAAATEPTTGTSVQATTEPAVTSPPVSMTLCPAASAPASGLPPGMLLDGKLMWVGPPPGSTAAQRQGFFVAFDALAVGRQRAWHLPLWQRLQLLGTLQLQDAEHNGALQQAASSSCRSISVADASSSRNVSKPRPVSLTTVTTAAGMALDKKQQAPAAGSDTITVLSKQHVPVTAQQLQQLQDSMPACPFPTDGLVFTPCALPYVLGMPQLLCKWQPPQVAAADITGSALQQMTDVTAIQDQQLRPRTDQPVDLAARAQAVGQLVRRLPPGLVYECLPLVGPEELEEGVAAEAAAAACLTAAQAQQQCNSMANMQSMMVSQCPWVPTSVRWDKARGNAPAAVELMQCKLSSSMYMSHDQLVHAAAVAAAAASSAAESVAESAGAAGAHVARSTQPDSSVPEQWQAVWSS
jgi:hypothetical protein